MVDNSSLPVASGNETFANDDIAGVKYPRPKINWGPDGTANDVDVASGKPLPVQLRGSDGTDRSNSLPVTVASGGIASGAVASGAVASGAFASGALASGSVASGAFASGSISSGAIAAGAIAAGATSIADNEDAASADGDRGVKILAVRKATPANTSGTDGDYEFLQMSAGRVWTDSNIRFAGTTPDLGSGTGGSATQRVIIDSSQFSALGQATMAASAPVVIANDQSQIKVNPGVSATANGGTASRVNAAASTNATNLKASAGQLYSIDVFNVAAYNVFLKLYNKASSPTVGTDTPVMTIPIQAGGGYSKTWSMGLPFSTGISYAITKLQADSDTTVVVAGDLTGNMLWI